MNHQGPLSLYLEHRFARGEFPTVEDITHHVYGDRASDGF